MIMHLCLYHQCDRLDEEVTLHPQSDESSGHIVSWHHEEIHREIFGQTK